MNRGYVDQLDYEGLQNYLQQIAQEGERSSVWSRIAGSELGPRIIEEQEERLRLVRAMYGKIPANSKHAAVLMAGVQGKEEEVSALLEMLTNAVNHKKSLDEDMAYVLECIRIRKDKEDSTAGSIVAHRAILETQEKK